LKTTKNWIIIGITISIELALLFNEYLHNQIDCKTFLIKSGIKITSASIGLVGSLGGIAVGTLIGSCIYPGLGTIIGAFIGGMLCGFVL
jgi:outer membrane lipoprotein SlyB